MYLIYIHLFKIYIWQLITGQRIQLVNKLTFIKTCRYCFLQFVFIQLRVFLRIFLFLKIRTETIPRIDVFCKLSEFPCMVVLEFILSILFSNKTKQPLPCFLSLTWPGQEVLINYILFAAKSHRWFLLRWNLALICW